MFERNLRKSLLIPNRFNLNELDEVSFFSDNSPVSSPPPCLTRSCKCDSSNRLAMENDSIDFNSFINRDPQRFSPARKRLNMDAHLTQSQSPPKGILSEQNVLRTTPTEVRVSSTGAFKRSECFDSSQSPQRTKRFRNENQPPATSSNFTINQQPATAKPNAMINVLLSSSEMQRRNRL